MGRYYSSKKEESDCLKNISASFLNKYGYFKDGWRSGTINWSRHGEKTGNISVQSSINEEDQYIRLYYTQTDRQTEEKTDFDYKIPLTTTPCYFGGNRYWFICPWYADSKYCGRRVGVLYLSNKYFACRHCNSLTYNSRNLGGWSKLGGQVVSIPELERLEDEVKLKYYNGKMTRKYRRYMERVHKSNYQFMIMAKRWSK